LNYRLPFHALLADFALAWGLLTAIPLPFGPEERSASLGRASAYFPLIGLILGGLLAVTGWLAYWLLPPGVAAALILAVWVGLTGMLHLDGFMDSCDGLLPPRESARRLEIMKDSRVGAFGVVAAILLLLLKFSALAALPAGARLPMLITIPVLARWTMTWLMARYPLARPGGMGATFAAGIGWQQIGVASIVTVAVAFGAGGWWGGLLLVVAWLAAALVARLAMARISGLTGDVYGATCEVVETVALLVAVAVRA
jgi:adenosylcobinamide-GDP ribazoletransferase